MRTKKGSNEFRKLNVTAFSKAPKLSISCRSAASGVHPEILLERLVLCWPKIQKTQILGDKAKEEPQQEWRAHTGLKITRALIHGPSVEFSSIFPPPKPTLASESLDVTLSRAHKEQSKCT